MNTKLASSEAIASSILSAARTDCPDVGLPATILRVTKGKFCDERPKRNDHNAPKADLMQRRSPSGELRD